MLIAETGLQRPKAKGLLQRAKDALVGEDRAFARTEPLMRTKVIQSFSHLLTWPLALSPLEELFSIYDPH